MSYKDYNKFSFKNKLSILLDRLDAAKTAIEEMPSGGGGDFEDFGFTIDEAGKVSRFVNENYALPTSVKTIGPKAMKSFARESNILTFDSKNLQTIEEDGLAYGFYGATYMTSAALPKVTSIGKNGLANAFYNDARLSSITLADNPTLGERALEYAFYGTGIKNVSGLKLSSIEGNRALSNAFYSCKALTSVPFADTLETVTGSYGLGSTFKSCTGLTNVTFSKLERVIANGMDSAFSGCTNLQSASFPALEHVGLYGLYSTFEKCTSLTTVSFPVLTKLESNRSLAYAFSGCTSLTSISFPSLVVDASYASDVFFYMLSGVTGCTLHFTAASEPYVKLLTGYPNFNGTNTTVLFDL